MMLPRVLAKRTVTLVTGFPKRSKTLASTEAVLPQLMLWGVMFSVIVAGGPATLHVTAATAENVAPPELAVTTKLPLTPMGTKMFAVATPPEVTVATDESPLLAEKTTIVPSGTRMPLLLTVAETTTELPTLLHRK